MRKVANISDKIEFKNGSYIIGVDLAKGEDMCFVNGDVQTPNVRGKRAEIVWYDDGFGNKKWYHRLLLDLQFAIEDIKDWTKRKYRSIIKLGGKIKSEFKR